MSSSGSLMKPTWRAWGSCLLVLVLTACSPEPAEVVGDWEEDGWSKVRTHGKVTDYVRRGKLKSERAQSIEASWIENGKRKTKLYPQTTHYHVVLRFFCRDGDEFVIVLRKRK